LNNKGGGLKKKVAIGAAIGAGAYVAYTGSKARAKFEAWKRKQEMNHNALIARNRKYGDMDMDLSSSSESWDTDTDPYVEWVYNDWNGWREEQGMLCRTDDDCWMGSNLACERNDMEFEVDHNWFGGDWERIIGQCECTVGEWDHDELQCQQVAATSGGGFWGSARPGKRPAEQRPRGKKGFFAGTAGILVILLMVGVGICCCAGIYSKFRKAG